MGLFWGRRRFCRATHDAETNIFRRRRAIGFWISGTIGTAADHLAFAIARQNPFGYVAAQVVNWLFVIFTLVRESCRLLSKAAQSRSTVWSSRAAAPHLPDSAQ